MTINTTLFTEWRDRTDWNAPQFNRDSPNLRSLLDYLRWCYGGVSLGCHTGEPVKAGSRPRAHHFGAALDWRWERHPAYPDIKFITRHQLDTEVLPFLIEWSQELGIQAIHDRGRIWRSVRANGNHGWQDYDTGYTGWIHIETTPRSFEDDVAIQARLDIATGIPDVVFPKPVAPAVDFRTGQWGLWPLATKVLIKRGDKGDIVRYMQSVISFKAGGNITIDGDFGPKTELRVRDLQAFFGLVIDGLVGKRTWALIDALSAVK